MDPHLKRLFYVFTEPHARTSSKIVNSIVIESILLHTNPAKVEVTADTLHLIASLVLFNNNAASGALFVIFTSFPFLYLLQQRIVIL